MKYEVEVAFKVSFNKIFEVEAHDEEDAYFEVDDLIDGLNISEEITNQTELIDLELDDFEILSLEES